MLSHQLHCCMPYLIITNLRELAIITQMHIFGKHIHFWDSYMIESEISIIFGIVTKFGSYVSNEYSREWLMSLRASDGDYEDLNSVFFAIHKELSLGYDMSGCYSHI